MTDATIAQEVMLLPWHRTESEHPRALAAFRRRSRERSSTQPMDRRQRRAFRVLWSCLPLPAGVFLEVADD